MLDFFADGGPFMWPLGLWSIISLAFFLERVFTYARLRSEEARVLRRIGQNGG